VASVLAAGAAAAASTFAVRNALYAGRPLPGARVVRVGLARPVTVVAAGHRLRLVPGDLLRVDAEATRRAALRANRGSFWHRAGSLLSPVGWRRELQPVYRVRRRAAGAFFAKLDRFGRPSRSASVRLEGLVPIVAAARSGTRLDQRAFLAALDRRAASGRGPVVGRYKEAVPTISSAAAGAAAAGVRTVLAAEVTLRYRGAEAGRVEPSQLAPLVRFEPQGGELAVTFDEHGLAKLIQPFVQRWRRRATNARLLVSGALVHVAPSQPGLDVDAPAAVSAVLAAASSPAARVAGVPMRAVRADLTTAAANALGIRRELVSFTTQMGASSSNRIHNVHLMADFIDGTIIKPGQVFSFNKVVGPRTADRGFLQGQEIIGSLVLPSIGGGVCQTATTLFNDAFETGLPILARTNHNLYLSHYPLGRDATVSWDGPDLQFRNDLRHAILIKSSYTDATLTFAFYGTPQGRRVVSTTGPKVNWRGPSMNYAIDPTKPPGSVEIVSGSGELGFDVTVDRTVYQQGRFLRKDRFGSHYIPDSPTTVYGPGGHPPGPYIVLPSQT